MSVLAGFLFAASRVAKDGQQPRQRDARADFVRFKVPLKPDASPARQGQRGTLSSRSPWARIIGLR